MARLEKKYFSTAPSQVQSHILQLRQQSINYRDQFCHQYKDLFEQNTSKPLKGYKVSIQIRPDVIPMYRKYYDISLQLRDQV